MDLKVSMANTTAGRGAIWAYLYNNTKSEGLDNYIHEVQEGVFFYSHSEKGIFVPQTTDEMKIRFDFENCVAADALDIAISYTVRRIT